MIETPNITLSPEIAALDGAFPAMRISVSVADTSDALKALIADECQKVMDLMGDQKAASHPAIQASRQAFKVCGKDPGRYRPSSEALMRRILSGKGLYHVSNVVDVGNIISMRCGYPVGCYDLAHVEGPITLRVAEAEDYEGIGRGQLNIEGLPCMADSLGPFGTPYSDSMRARVRETTTDFLFILFGFGCSEDAATAIMADAKATFGQWC